MLSCREMTELVTDYLENRMPLLNRIRFRLHIGICRHCRSYLAQMRAAIRTLGRLPEERERPEVPEELLRRFASWRK